VLKTKEIGVNKDNEILVRKKFDMHATIAVAGKAMSKPNLNIVPDDEFEAIKPVSPATMNAQTHVSATEAGIQQEAQDIKLKKRITITPGMTGKEIKALIEKD
jgi:hypothetical protein